MSEAKRARCVMDQFAMRYIVLIYDLVGSLDVTPAPFTQVATHRQRFAGGAAEVAVGIDVTVAPQEAPANTAPARGTITTKTRYRCP